MKRILALVDGFNLYHSMADRKDLSKYKWLNLRKLIECFTIDNEEIVNIIYFSAYAFWKPERVIRHQTYVNALRTVNVKPVMSEFKRKTLKCKLCKKVYTTYEEKQTDVQIAINLFREGMNDSYDKAMIVSGDSDLIPAIEAVKSKFPAKTIHILFPPKRAIESLKQVADQYSKIKEKHLASSQFSDTIKLDNNKSLIKPIEWK